MTIEYLSQWAQFGILGTVIGALFAVIVLGFKVFMAFITNMHEHFKGIIKEVKDQHSSDLSSMQENFNKERQRWELQSEKRDIKYEATMTAFSKSLDSLSQAIREIREKML